MSRTKSLTDLNGELGEIVKTILFEIGAVKTCPIHEDVLIDNFVDDKNQLAKECDLYTEAVKGDFSDEDFDEMIEMIMATTHNSCPYCF